MPRTSEHLQSDPSLAASLADRFGAGAGNAESLIQANRLRHSQGLTAATLQVKDEAATADVDRDAVASELGIDRSQILDVAVRGDHIVVVAEDSEGRSYKDYLNHDGSLVDEADDPERASLRAEHEASAKIREAQVKAAEIVAEAEAEAAKVRAKGAADARKDAKQARADAYGDDAKPKAEPKAKAEHKAPAKD